MLGLAIGVIFAGFIIFMRLKKNKKPIQLRKIILAPLFMSTGFLMFVYSPFRPDPRHVLLAFAVGVLFSIPLIVSTSFEVRGSEVYVKPSKMFIITLIALFAIRTVIRIYASESISDMQSSGMFFIMAFGMILPWRIGMAVKYKNLVRTQQIEEKNR